MDFRKELWTKAISLGIVGLQIVFEAKEINEITWINSVEREKITQDQALINPYIQMLIKWRGAKK